MPLWFAAAPSEKNITLTTDGQSVRRAVNNSEDCGASDCRQQLPPTSGAPSGCCWFNWRNQITSSWQCGRYRPGENEVNVDEDAPPSPTVPISGLAKATQRPACSCSGICCFNFADHFLQIMIILKGSSKKCSHFLGLVPQAAHLLSPLRLFLSPLSSFSQESFFIVWWLGSTSSGTGPRWWLQPPRSQKGTQRVVCTLVITVAIPKIHGTGHMAHFAGNLLENHSGVRLLHFTYAGCGHNSFRRARHIAGPIKTICHKTLDGDVWSRKNTPLARQKRVCLVLSWAL